MAETIASKSHQVEFFEASCCNCRQTFAMPLLPEQSYGQFILHGEKSGAFGFLFAIGEPAWEDIHDRLQRTGHLKNPPGPTDIVRFHRVIAAAADAISGQALIMDPTCPACGSNPVEWRDAKPLGVREVPSVTFTGYQSLSESEKTKKAEELWGRA